MQMNNLLKGAIVRVLEFFSNVIVGLLMMPFLIRSLGDSAYGLWVLVGSFLGYYALFDMGLGSAVERFVSRAVGLRDQVEINKIITTSLFVFTLLGVVALVSSICVSLVVPFLIKNIVDKLLFQKLVIILGMNLALSFPMRSISAILSSNLRFDINSLIDISKLLLRAGSIVLCFHLGYGIIALAVITVFWDVFSGVLRYIVVRRLFCYIRISTRLIDVSKIKSLFSYSIFTFIAQIADQLRFNIDNLVITIFIGLNAVTTFSIAATLMRYFLGVVIAALGMFAPVFSQHESRSDYDSIRSKFLFMTKISCCLSMSIAGIMIVFGNTFIKLWIGGTYSASYQILLILVIPMAFALSQSPSVQVLYGVSKHKFFAISNASEGLLNLLLSLILVRQFGLLGVALGTAIAMAIVQIFVQPVFVCKVLNIKLKEYYSDLLLPVYLLSVVYIVIFRLIMRVFMPNGWIMLFIWIVVYLVLYVCGINTFGFSPSERSRIIKIVGLRINSGVRKD